MLVSCAEAAWSTGGMEVAVMVRVVVVVDKLFVGLVDAGVRSGWRNRRVRVRRPRRVFRAVWYIFWILILNE